jgi:hypothetical protein
VREKEQVAGRKKLTMEMNAGLAHNLFNPMQHVGDGRE